MKESSLKVCPVPNEQLPVNEYEQLKNAWFFSWGQLDLISYLRKLTWIGFWGYLVAGPIAAASFPPHRQTLLFLLSGAAGACFLVLLASIQLYLGWSYVGDRLNQETISYEESGWYDGQTWTKPPEVLVRDRLIFTHQVNPVLNRLRRTMFGLILFIVTSVILCFSLN